MPERTVFRMKPRQVDRPTMADAAVWCQHDLTAIDKEYVRDSAKRMNKLALLMSRREDTANLSAFMLALFGVAYKPMAIGWPQDSILSVLAKFDYSMQQDVFAPQKAQRGELPTRLYSFGSAVLSSRPKDEQFRSMTYGEYVIQNVTKYRVSIDDDRVLGKIIVPAYSVEAKLLSEDPEVSQPLPAEFVALTVIRSIDKHRPTSFEEAKVFWNQDILRKSDAANASEGIANLARVQEAFQHAPGYNFDPSAALLC